MSCNYNNCTDVTFNFYQGETFLTLLDPTIFSASKPQPIYFYDAYSCPEPLCCNPDVVASVASVTATGVSLTAGLSAPVMNGWKACHTAVVPCVQDCGPCPSDHAGQVTPLGIDCANAASSWSCCPPEVHCKSTTGKVFRLVGYGCDGYCYNETAIINANTVTTRAPTTIEQNYVNLFWPSSPNLYGQNCNIEVLLIDGVPWWFANHKIFKYPDCAAWVGQDQLNNINHTKVTFGQAPWKAQICWGSASSSSGVVPTTTGCNSYCLREVTVEWNCTSGSYTVTTVSEDCYDYNNLPAASTFGVGVFNEFFEDTNCGSVVNGETILRYKAVIIDSVCTPQGTNSSCACGPVQRPINQLFTNWLSKTSLASCVCPSISLSSSSSSSSVSSSSVSSSSVSSSSVSSSSVSSSSVSSSSVSSSSVSSSSSSSSSSVSSSSSSSSSVSSSSSSSSSLSPSSNPLPPLPGPPPPGPPPGPPHPPLPPTVPNPWLDVERRKFKEYRCTDLNHLDIACDFYKLSNIAPNRYVNLTGLPCNGGQVCTYDPHNTFHFVVNYNSSRSLFTCASSNRPSNIPSDGCYMYMWTDDICHDSSLPDVDLRCYYALDNCCECDDFCLIGQSSTCACSSYDYNTTNPSISVIQHPAKYCYAQQFEVIEFYSKPKDWNTCITYGTTSASPNPCGAEYKAVTPGTKTISIKVPRAYETHEVHGKWLVLYDDTNCEHRYYRIVSTSYVESPNSGGTP